MGLNPTSIRVCLFIVHETCILHKTKRDVLDSMAGQSLGEPGQTGRTGGEGRRGREGRRGEERGGQGGGEGRRG